jgi:aminopeptidase 2
MCVARAAMLSGHICADTQYHQMIGLYRSRATSLRPNSPIKYIATTQLEATEARRVFPCLDEPHLKATFELSITTEPQYSVLSNTDPVENLMSRNGQYRTVRFGKTPLMSTYLLAFTVSDLDFCEVA